ncbi:MAG: HPr family phosphocarrier protein [bacterium]
MPTRSFTVRTSGGMHARPWARFVGVTSRYRGVTVTVVKDGMQTDGKSLLGLLTLEAEPGSTLEVTAEGDEAETLLNELADLLAKDLDKE